MQQLQQLYTAARPLAARIWDCGIPLVISASLLFNLSALFIKVAGQYIPVLEICLIRSVVSLAVTLLWASSIGVQPLFGQRKSWRLLAARGLFGTLSVTSSFASYVLLPLGDAATVSQLRQPVSAVLARLLLSEPLGLQGVAGCLVSMAGVVTLAHPPFLFGGEHWSTNRLWGMACGVNFTVCSAAVAYTIRRIGRSEHTFTIALWFHACIVVVTTTLLAAGWPQKPVLPRPQDVPPLCAISVLTYFGQLAMTRALQITPIAMVSSLAFLGVIWGHLLGALFLSEAITPGGAIGAVIIFIGVLLVVLRWSSPATTAAATCDSSGTDGTKGCTGPTQQLAELGGSGDDNMQQQDQEHLPLLSPWQQQQQQQQQQQRSSGAVSDKLPTQQHRQQQPWRLDSGVADTWQHDSLPVAGQEHHAVAIHVQEQAPCLDQLADLQGAQPAAAVGTQNGCQPLTVPAQQLLEVTNQQHDRDQQR